jgi:hypothetical protein
MKDGPVRRAVKLVALANFVVNLRFTRAWRRLRGERPYSLGGDCRRCARCCEAPGIQVGRLSWYLPLLRRLFLLWQRHVNGFVLVERDWTSRSFIFRCTHFDPVTRSCDSYASRPGMCRDYPRLLLYQPSPELLSGCGYRPLAPNALRLGQALAAAELTPEQRRRLSRDLFLE